MAAKFRQGWYRFNSHDGNSGDVFEPGVNASAEAEANQTIGAGDVGRISIIWRQVFTWFVFHPDSIHTALLLHAPTF